MGNYTWFVKCFSNGPVDQPIFDIIQCLSSEHCMEHIDHWFNVWARTLTPQSYQTFMEIRERFWKTGDASTIRQTLLEDMEFPRKISLLEVMDICTETKLYGYLEDGLQECMKVFGQCLPPNQFFIMMGIYENSGPVVMGWMNGNFLTMLGFKSYKVCDTYFLEDPSLTPEKYLKTINIKNDPSWEALVEKDYIYASEFLKNVLELIDTTDWSITDPIQWLQARGFRSS